MTDITPPDKPTRKKPGPRPGQRKTATKTVEGVVVGRDKKVIPADEVYKLAQIGCKDTEISEWFGINSDTLRYNFKVELLKGRESLKHSLRRAQIEVALKGNSVMLIWLGKNLLGQSDAPLEQSDNLPLPWSNSDD